MWSEHLYSSLVQFPYFLFLLWALDSQRKEWEHLVWLPTPWEHLVSMTLLLPLIISITISFPRVTQILKGMLEGASHILPALRVLSSLLSSCSDSVPLYSFCREAGLPGLLLSLLRHSQESNSIQQVSATQGALKTSRSCFSLDFSSSNCHLCLAQLPFIFFPPLSSY